MFKPEILAKFKGCRIEMLDSPDDIIPAALNYLGLDPRSIKPLDLERAIQLLMKIRPSVLKCHFSEYNNALATGDICSRSAGPAKSCRPRIARKRP